MTGKERAQKRAEANALQPLFQIGKEGVSEAVFQQLEQVFATHELVKIKLHLDTCPQSPREAAGLLAQNSGAEVIQVIGGVVVLYRYNPQLHEEKKKPGKTKALPPPSKRRSITERARRYRKER